MSHKTLIEKILKEQTNYYSDGYFENDGYCVYIFENLVNGKKYIGKANNFKARLTHHLYDLNLDYPIYNAIRKYGIDKFRVVIVERAYSENEVLQKEMQYIANYKTNIHKYGNHFGYNLTDGGEGASGFKHSHETRAKLSQQKLGKPGKPHTDDFKIKLSIRNKGNKYGVGKKFSDETRALLSERARGRKHSETTKSLLSNIRKTEGKWAGENNPNFGGKIMTDETRNRFIGIDISGANNPMYGKHHSEETKKKISEHHKLNESTKGVNNGRAIINQNIADEIRKIYDTDNLSQRELGEIYGISRGTVCAIIEGKIWKR